MKDDAAFVDRCFDGCPDPERGRTGMDPVRLWFGLVFLATGVLAILDATETIAWSKTFEEWWPLAIVGWGLADMLAEQHTTKLVEHLKHLDRGFFRDLTGPGSGIGLRQDRHNKDPPQQSDHLDGCADHSKSRCE